MFPRKSYLFSSGAGLRRVPSQAFRLFAAPRAFVTGFIPTEGGA